MKYFFILLCLFISTMFVYAEVYFVGDSLDLSGFLTNSLDNEEIKSIYIDYRITELDNNTITILENKYLVDYRGPKKSHILWDKKMESISYKINLSVSPYIGLNEYGSDAPGFMNGSYFVFNIEIKDGMIILTRSFDALKRKKKGD